MRFISFLFFLFFSLLSLQGLAQIDHWETVIFADDIWKYQVGSDDYPQGWYEADFNDSDWDTGAGGFGYGDGDDGTTVFFASSVALRKTFEVIDSTKINAFILSADFDDGFVAFLNGQEIARANMEGSIGTPPPYNSGTPTDHEADLYQNQQPEYFFLPNAADFLKNGENTLAIQVNNVTNFSSDLSSNFYLSFGINDSSNDYQENPNWFVPPLEFTSSDLPILVIDTDGQTIVDDPRITAHLGIIDNGADERNYLTDSFNDYDGQISIEIRGASSQFFDKVGYSLETQNPDGSNNNVSLLEMPEENDWVLHGPYSDKSLMRNALTYHFVRNMGQYAPRTRSCELVINGEYMGYYVLMERIKRDENRLDIAKVRPEDVEGDELTGGYLFQIDRDDLTILDGWYSNHWPYTFYAFDDPDYDQINSIQHDYIEGFMVDFENAMNANNFAQSYPLWIDVPSFIDYVIATEITKEIDAYRLSFFMYKRKDSNGGKLHFGPIWDINLGYGNYDYGCDNSPEGWAYDWHDVCNEQAFWLKKIATIPAVKDKIRCRWEELREDVLATDNLLSYIDDMAAEVAEAQDRNFQRYPILGQYVWPNAFVGDTYQSEVNFLKNWLSDRLDWMEENLNGDCNAVDVDDEIAKAFNTVISPNPFDEQVRFLVKSDLIANGEVHIFNTLGQVISTQPIQTNQPLLVNTEFFKKGIYYYKIYINNQQIKGSSLIRLVYK